MKYQGRFPERFEPEEKLELIQLARYSGLGFEKTLDLFGLQASRVWRWIRRIEEKGFDGLIDQPTTAKSLPSKYLPQEEDLVLKKASEYTKLNHRKLAHQIFRDENIFISETLTYRILKKNNLIIPKTKVKIIAAETWRHKPKTINELWHIDISYIPCGINDKNKIIFWYLIVVLDGFSRYVIAWNLFPDMKKERCFDVVDQAVFLSQVPKDKRPKLLSDNGKQFRAKSAKEFFKGLLNIKQIFSSPNHPETNGKIERLFQTVKYESLYREDYCSAKEAKEILLDFFNEYNNFRFHQALEYRTPRESYYGLNKDYTKRRQEAKGQIIKRRKEYWTKSGETLTFQRAKNLLKH